MTDTTQLVISVQGKRGSGRTTCAEKVIVPALKAAGCTIEKFTDGDKGAFLSVAVPQGQLAKIVARGHVRELTVISDAVLLQMGKLLERRKQALLALKDETQPHIATWPKYVPQECALALLTEHATEELLRIDAGLADLGFRFVEDKAKA